MTSHPAQRRTRVLIIDGFSNHDWRRTTQLICSIIEPTALFDISISTAPSLISSLNEAPWSPDFSHYDVVIQTCNDINHAEQLWPLQVRQEFERFVSNGGGVYVFHAGNNAFQKWYAYNKMIGIGWRGHEYGTAIRVDCDNSLLRIPPGEGKGTGHGARTDRVIHRLGEHPIHTGFPSTWITPLIEVYTYARGPADNISILSWAEDPETRERWPMEWTVGYGKGRIYSSTFGHIWEDEVDPVNFRCAGFQTLLIRTLQWLAQRNATLPVPSDFPTATSLSLR